MNNYGQELILDLHQCDVSTFTRKSIEAYFINLCELINMDRQDLHFWDDEGLPEEEKQTDPKTKGISAVQFILTSSVVIHALELMEAAYINIFSCKEFDIKAAIEFTVGWFQSKSHTTTTVSRR